jgi:hypothetical protein
VPGFKPCTYQVKSRFENVPFNCNVQRYIMGDLPLIVMSFFAAHKLLA